jgi:peptidoglycan/LPS O-acetylase OafA/YrhL
MRLAKLAKDWIAACFAARATDNPWLDMLRCVAIVLVLLRHGQWALLQVAEPRQSSLFDLFALNGWVGVDLFFVLSGYLLGAKLLAPRAPSDRVATGAYLQDRARRILPAYLLVLGLTVSGAFPGFTVSGEDLTWRVLYHLLFLQDILPSDINVVFWSLGVEVKFYLVLPLIAYLLLQMRSPFALIGVIVCGGSLIRVALYLQMDSPIDYTAFWYALRSPFYASLEPLFLGTAVGLLTVRGMYLSQTVAKALLAVTLAGCAVWFSADEFMGTITLWDVSGQPLTIALIFAAAVWAAASRQGTCLWAEPVFRIGARLSYSVYLVHLPLLPLSLYLGGATRSGEITLFWLVYLASSLCIAGVIYVAVECPFLRQRPRHRAARAVAPDQPA